MLSPGLKLLQVLSILGAEARIKYAYRWVRTVVHVDPGVSDRLGKAQKGFSSRVRMRSTTRSKGDLSTRRAAFRPSARARAGAAPAAADTRICGRRLQAATSKNWTTHQLVNSRTVRPQQDEVPITAAAYFRFDSRHILYPRNMFAFPSECEQI